MKKDSILPFYLFENEDQDPQEEPPGFEEEEFYGYVVLLNITRVASTPGFSYSFVFNSAQVVNNLAGVFQNIFEKSEVFGLSDPIDWKSHFWELLTDPLGYFPEMIDRGGNNLKCTNFKIYTGLIPKQKRLLYANLFSFDPYSNLHILERTFENSKRIFDTQVTGMERRKMQNEEEIKKYFLQNPTHIYLLDNKPEIKDRILKELGLKDLGKIGKNLNLGLI